jgi:hypothetical protein
LVFGGRVFDVEEVELGLAEGFGFGFACGKVTIEMLHEYCCAGIIDGPEGGN